MTNPNPPFENFDRVELNREHGVGAGLVTSVFQDRNGEWLVDITWDDDPSTIIDYPSLSVPYT